VEQAVRAEDATKTEVDRPGGRQRSRESLEGLERGCWLPEGLEEQFVFLPLFRGQWALVQKQGGLGL